MARVSGPAAFPILGRVFLAVGAAFLLVAAIFALSRSSTLSSMHAADGEVVALHRQGRSFVPTVVFKDESGKAIRFDGTIGSSPPAYRVGEAVRVHYDPARPEDALVDGFWNLWFFAALFSLIGLPFAAVGVSFLVASRVLKSRASSARTT